MGFTDSRGPDIAEKVATMGPFGPKKSDKVPDPNKAGKRLKHREHRGHRGCMGTFIDVSVRQMDQGSGRARQEIWTHRWLALAPRRLKQPSAANVYTTTNTPWIETQEKFGDTQLNSTRLQNS